MSDLRINNITDKVGGNGPVIAGVSTVASTGAFTVPVGPTEYRGGRGRAVIHCGGYPSAINTLNYVTIATTGNAQDFGDARDGGYARGACSSSTRGIIGGGAGSSYITRIEYVTTSSSGGGNDFGDLGRRGRFINATSNNTRGTFMGGHWPGYTPAASNIIDFVTIASTGDAADFGDLILGRSANGCCSSPTRGFTAGSQGFGPAFPLTNTIESIVFSTTGNATSFGNLTAVSQSQGSFSSTTRGLWGGGNPGSITNRIDYVTLTTSGNALDFGDLTLARTSLRGTSSLVRGLFVGGYVSPLSKNIIEYVTIASTGNAVDFGDITAGGYKAASLSDCHGGIG